MPKRRIFDLRVLIGAVFVIYGIALGVLCFFVLMQTFSSAPTEFLYFQF